MNWLIEHLTHHYEEKYIIYNILVMHGEHCTIQNSSGMQSLPIH